MATHRERRDRRHSPAPASPWKLILTAIGLLYVLFLVRVNNWTTGAAESRANAVGGGGDDGAGRVVHVKDATLVQSDHDLQSERRGAVTTTASFEPPKPQLRAAPEMPSPSTTVAIVTSATATDARPAYIDVAKSTLTAAPAKTMSDLMRAAPTHQPLEKSKREAPGGAVRTVATMTTTTTTSIDAQAPTEPARVTPAVEEEKAAHDHEAEDAADEQEAPIHLAVTTTKPPARTPAATLAGPTFESRHDVISGYEQTKEYLQNYRKDPLVPEREGLFLFFTCSDDDGNMHDWSTLCVEARKKVYDVFAKSPAGNRLVTIRAGSEEFWEYRNDFSNDRDLRVKSVPCVMKWEGRGGETSGMMIGASLLYEPFLRYLFQNVDRPDAFLTPDASHKKHIITLTSRAEYDAYMSAYRREAARAPLFLFFVSGRIEDNKRPWCPYCRYSEIPAEYSFYAFAPVHARLVRIEVTKTYKEWKQPNDFNTDPVLALRGVPAFFRILPAVGSDDLVYQRIIERFDLMETWRGIYEGAI